MKTRVNLFLWAFEVVLKFSFGKAVHPPHQYSPKQSAKIPATKVWKDKNNSSKIFLIFSRKLSHLWTMQSVASLSFTMNINLCLSTQAQF